MVRLTNLLRQAEFQVLCFCLGLILFNWHFLSVSFLVQPQYAFIWFFLIWAVAIFALFLISRAVATSKVIPGKDRGYPCSTPE